MIQERNGQISLPIFQMAIKNLYSMLVCFSESTTQWSMENYPGYEYSELVCHQFDSLHEDTKYQSQTAFKLEYRVSYSIAYEVPVLMVRLQSFSGCALSIDCLKERFVGSDSESTRDNCIVLLAGFSQVEHPYLGIPYYQFHPCRTAGLMQQALSVEHDISEVSGTKYLVLWLSLIATPAGLVLPRELAFQMLDSDRNTLVHSISDDHSK